MASGTYSRTSIENRYYGIKKDEPNGNCLTMWHLLPFCGREEGGGKKKQTINIQKKAVKGHGIAKVSVKKTLKVDVTNFKGKLSAAEKTEQTICAVIWKGHNRASQKTHSKQLPSIKEVVTLTEKKFTGARTTITKNK